MRPELDPKTLRAGRATRAGTEAYVRTFGQQLPDSHYSDFLNLHLKLSSLGVGTFPGAACDAIDAAYRQIVARAALAGINVFDTAAHYRYGRSPRALGAGLAEAFTQGVAREQVFVIGKGGFLAFDSGIPEDFAAWFEQSIAQRGLGTRADVSGVHLLSAAHIAYQIDRLRELTGLSCLDAFLIDQPEVHVPTLGKTDMQRRLQQCFTVCEQAIKTQKIGCYGIASFDSFRVEPDAASYLSLPSLLALAERAAVLVRRGQPASHGFRMITLPFNPVMSEGFTRFNQATGLGNVASTLQAAHQLRVFAIGSHALMKGVLAHNAPAELAAAMPACGNDAQRTLQFNRSTPGLGVTLAGISTPEHLDDLVRVARMAPLERSQYLRLYQRA